MLEAFKPKKVMYFFEEITKILHCSGEEQQISDYLVKFANERGLEVHQDQALNVLIKKAGSPGKENQTPVILQGHMDMVCVKNDGFDFDFASMPIPIKVDGDWIKTEGTSLGADNGIAVAMILALLDDAQAIHPPIEALITTEEEVGLLGAAAVDGNLFQGKTLINIDSEEEGIFLSSCAGGVRNTLAMPVQWEENPYQNTYRLTIEGLQGGHSGMEIDKGRANSNKLLGRILTGLKEFRIHDLWGGEKMNAIAKKSVAILASDQDVESVALAYENIFKNEYAKKDPDITIKVEKIDRVNRVLTEKSTEQAVALLLLIPHGIKAMSQHIEGLVETSTNFGVLSLHDDQIICENAHRSSVESKKETLIQLFDSIARLVGGTTEKQGDYPGWQFEPESKIRELFIEVYEEISGKKASVEAVHAGLECGVLQERIGKLDMISFGPNMADVHTPQEKLSVSSVEKTYELLVEVLKKIL